jgi:tetratricopeptide (TPR) repeat protein
MSRGQIKMRGNRSVLFFLKAALCVMAVGSLFGCARHQQNMPSWNEYGNYSKQIADLQSKRATSLADDTIKEKTLPKMTAEELERSGDLLLSGGNLSKAFVQYERASELRSDNIRLRYKKGLLFLLGKLNDDAIKEFQAVIDKEPDYALAYQGLGEASFQEKRYDQAEQNFQRAVWLEPKLWKARNTLGIIYAYQKRYDLAIKEYNAALTLRPDNGLLYNNLGISYAMAGDNERAIDSFNKALQAGYLGDKIYNNLGLVLARSGRYEEALGAFKKGGEEAHAYNNLGCVYLDQGQFDKAIRYFEKAIKVSPTFYLKAGENLEKAERARDLSLDSSVKVLSKNL